MIPVVQVPFGDSFHQSLQWACQHEGQGRCRLRITGQVNFTKACFVKGIIQKASEEVRLSKILCMLTMLGILTLLCELLLPYMVLVCITSGILLACRVWLPANLRCFRRPLPSLGLQN